MIRSLKNTNKKSIVDCLHLAFSDYELSMKMPYEYWINRWDAARIDYSLSYGYFDKEELVGFILHGIDNHQGKKSFFNMATGVVPEFRGQRIVKQLYSIAIPELKKSNCNHGLLEVLQGNEKAIKSYQSIGYEISQNLLCYKSKNYEDNSSLEFKSIDNLDLQKYRDLQRQNLSWERNDKTIYFNPTEFSAYEMNDNNEMVGFAVIKNSNKTITQFGVLNNDWNKWGQDLFVHIVSIEPKYKIINIDERDSELIEFFTKAKFEELIRQYEMKIII